MAKDIFDAVYGSLIGGAIGDALGAPVEMWNYMQIRNKYGRVDELLPGNLGNTGAFYGGTTGDRFHEQYDGPTTPPGTFTDDTTLRHYLCLSIVQKGGRVTPDDFAQVLLEKLNKNRLWLNERITLNKLKAGMCPWNSGKGNIPAGCAVMAIAPVGIINAGNPGQAYQDGYNVASINTDDESRAGAATAAAGVAAAFNPGASIDTIIEAMNKYCNYIYKRAFELIMELADSIHSVDEFVEKYYSKMLDWTWPGGRKQDGWYESASSLEIVPVTMAMLHLCRDDVNQAIIEGASFGRDCDSIASLVGCIAGALHGASSIRPDWIEVVEKANEEFFEEVEGDKNANLYAMATRMVKALHMELEATLDRVKVLETILS
jgi:ADP-ribosylglycohydrolase